VSAPPVALAPDLEAALRRLKLAKVREIAPEVVITARTQRWVPEELLRTLIEPPGRTESSDRPADRAERIVLT
jgi:hypothetical protein